MLTVQSLAKATFTCLFFSFLFDTASGQCPVSLTTWNDLNLNYEAGTAPDNISDVDVSFDDPAMNGNYDLHQAGNTWATLGEDFNGIEATGDIIIHFNDGSSSVSCNYVNGEFNDLLPVELNTFEGLLDENNILLSWSTLSETQHAGFEIERSFDGDRFEKIGSIAGAGTTDDRQWYAFTDFDVRNIALGGSVYYRLKHIDFSGNSSFSPIISIDLELDTDGFEITKITGWNSPERVLKVYFYNPAQIRKIQLVLAAINGRVAINEAFYPTPGYQFIELDLRALKDQLYFISLNNGKEIISEKLFLQSLFR